MARPISIADVAREAGVSPMTVSRVVRDKEDVSPKTRAKVLEVVERLGYQPNGIARGLVTQRTGTIGLVMPDVANPFFSDIALAVETEAYEENYNVFLCNTSEDPKREIDILNSLYEKRVDGIIVCSSRLPEEKLRESIQCCPAAVLTNRRLQNSDVSAVLVDHYQGGYDAARYLIERGHRKIGFLSGPDMSHGGYQRAEGFYAAATEAGVSLDSNWRIACSPTTEDGFRTTIELLTDYSDLTALFCYNDLIAAGALQACAELNLRVPDDIAIIGFDDIPLSALVTPALTTCRVPRFIVGIRAANLLFTKLKDMQTTPEEIVMRPELVVRDSA